MKKNGFTLVELLIVIGIIGILAGLLSTAIMQLMKVAGRNKNANDASLIEAAIVEYWHDNGRWPIPTSGNKSSPEYTENETQTTAGASSDTFYGYKYSLTFYEDNNLVVQELMNAKLRNGTTKDYLALKGLLAPCKANLAKNAYPVVDLCDAGLLYDGDAVYSDPADSNYGSKIPARKDPVLCYRAEFIVCPHCDTAYSKTSSRKTCTNDDCPYYKSSDSRYYFSAAERKHPQSRGVPFTIYFDFDANTCEVIAR